MLRIILPGKAERYGLLMADYTTGIKKDNLERAIRNAFAHTPRPVDTEIIDCPGDYEADQVYNHVVGKTWQQLLAELLQCEEGPELYFYHSSYHFFTPQAFHYYLPTFMVVSLDPLRADIVCEHLLYALAPSAHFREEFSSFVSRLNPEQTEVIRLFILYIWDVYNEFDMCQ